MAAPVYSTLPVRRMGEMFLLDAVHSQRAIRELDTLGPADVKAAFSGVNKAAFSGVNKAAFSGVNKAAFSGWVEMRYSQRAELAPGLTATPFNAGRYLGGSVWRVDAGGEEVFYAPGFHHRSERHLAPARLQAAFMRPALFVCCAPSDATPPRRALAPPDALVGVLLETLRGGGSVLVPSDAAGRVLEVALLLEEHWAKHRPPYPLLLLGRQAEATLARASTQLEWMRDRVGADFATKRRRAFFDLACLRAVGSWEAFQRLPPGPKVVLASSPSLECGLSRRLFLEWAPSRLNAVCFVEPARPGTLAHTLQAATGHHPELRLRLQVASRVPLLDAELRDWEAAREEAARARGEAAGKASEEEAGLLGGGLLGGVEEEVVVGVEMQTEMEDGREEEAAAGYEEPDHVLCDNFAPAPNCPYSMFPDDDDEPAWDDYGQVLQEGEMRKALGDTAVPNPKAVERAAERDEDEAEQPTKVVTEDLHVTVRAALRCFDFEGLADGKALGQVLADMAPRHVVFLQGSPTARQELSDLLRTRRLHVAVHQVQEAGGVLRLTLPASRVLRLSGAVTRWRTAGSSTVASVEGRVTNIPPQDPQLCLGLQDHLDQPMVTDAGGFQLTVIMKALTGAGVAAAWRGHSLECGSGVRVYLGDDRLRIVLEGPPCDEYYRVREVVYGVGAQQRYGALN
jgi:cleavage and polyadenylation specificity factor subunit 2